MAESLHTFRIHILAADHKVFEGDCESLVLPLYDGQYGVKAHHGNMISAVVPGLLSYREPGGENKTVYVSSGLIKVEDNDVLILVDSAELPEEIDIKRAERAAEDAQKLLQRKRNITEIRMARAHLARAVGRLKVKRYYDKKMKSEELE